MRYILWILIVLLIFVPVWLAFSPPEPAPFEMATDHLHQKLLPSGGTATEPTITRTRLEAKATWQVDQKREWSRYKKWAKAQLGAGYEVTSEDDSHIAFRRKFSAEVHDVELRVKEDPPQIVVQFTVTPW